MTPAEQITKMTTAIKQAIKVMGDRFGSTETDVAKAIQAPIWHVNGDDPEAVVLASQLALEYRMTFGQDVVVDITCFRKLGHNEQDTPSLTQPLMYKKITAHPATRKLYGDKLAAQGVLAAEGPDAMVKSYRAKCKNEIISR